MKRMISLAIGVSLQTIPVFAKGTLRPVFDHIEFQESGKKAVDGTNYCYTALHKDRLRLAWLNGAIHERCWSFSGDEIRSKNPSRRS